MMEQWQSHSWGPPAFTHLWISDKEKQHPLPTRPARGSVSASPHLLSGAFLLWS